MTKDRETLLLRRGEGPDVKKERGGNTGRSGYLSGGDQEQNRDRVRTAMPRWRLTRKEEHNLLREGAAWRVFNSTENVRTEPVVQGDGAKLNYHDSEGKARTPLPL